MRAPDLETGETLLREIASDRARYWRDHGLLALVGMLLAGGALVALGVPHPAIGALGAPLAIAVRAAYLASERLGQRGWLTDRRLWLPGGGRVGLAEIAAVRRLMGDVQIVTRGGDKHLIRHVADPARLVAAIEAARTRPPRRARA